MVDLVAKIVWYRLTEVTSTWSRWLDELSLRVDQWLWQTDMDPLGFLLLCWILLAGLVYLTAEPVRELLIKFLGNNPPPAVVNRPATPINSKKSVPNQSVEKSTPSAAVAPSVIQANNYGSPPTMVNQAPSETLQARVKLINFSQEGSDWVNNVLNWLYHRYNTTPEFADIWLSALNDYAKRNAQQLGMLVTFDRFLSTTRPPKIADVRAELSADEQLSIFCSVEMVQLGFSLLATVTTETGQVVTETYDVDIDHGGADQVRYVNINDMRQLRPPSPPASAPADTRHCFQLIMNIFPSPQNDILLSAEFEKEPREMVVNVRSLAETDTDTMASYEELEPELLREAVRQCILNTITIVKLARFRDFPFPHWHRYSSRPSSPLAKEPLQTHFPFNAPADLSPFKNGDHQLLVKVVRATGIGGGSVGVEPYCVIEMDEPPQKHTTSIVKSNGNHPLWEESFKFDISPDTSEVLFELYDRTKPQKRNFLGTAIVGLQELRKNPSQRQIIPLQPRPLTNDSVTGTLALEFSVLAGGVPLSDTIMDVNVPYSPVGQSKLGSNPNRQSPIHSADTKNTSPGRVVSGEFFSSTTTKTPAVQRSRSEDMENGPIAESQTPKQKRKLNLLAVPKSATEGHLAGGDYLNDEHGKERSKSSDRKSFFGRLKRRFSLGKKRSKSLDPQTAKEEFYMVTSTSTNGIPEHMEEAPVDRVLTTNSLSRKDMKARKKEHARSRSAPGSREPSASRSTNTSTKAHQPSWKDKLRSRFSRRKEHETSSNHVISTQPLQL